MRVAAALGPEVQATAAEPQAAGPLKVLLLRPREAAHVLSISERLLWSMTAPRGPIPVVRIGSAVRYSAEAIRDWISARQRGGER
jgi:predicted DNA-binding transcriptional regulator AlpA